MNIRVRVGVRVLDLQITMYNGLAMKENHALGSGLGLGLGQG
jgi:hypothetical protein